MEVRTTVVEGQLKPLDRVEIVQPLRKHVAREAGESGPAVLSQGRFYLQGTFGNV